MKKYKEVLFSIDFSYILYAENFKEKDYHSNIGNYYLDLTSNEIIMTEVFKRYKECLDILEKHNIKLIENPFPKMR